MTAPHPDPNANATDIPESADIKDFVDVPDGIRWDCVRCLSCCGNVFSRTWLDIDLRKYIGEPVNGFCKHLDVDGHRCTVHGNRPNTCRGFPFILRKDGDAYKVQIYRGCPGLGKGPLIDMKEKVLELVKLSEDEFGTSFIIDWGVPGAERIRLYRVK